MKLIYRGQSYEYEPGVGEAPVVEQVREPRASYTLQYRGMAYTVDPNVVVRQPVVRPVTNLIYRGVTYGMNGWQPSAEQAKGTVTPEGTPWKMGMSSELSAIHRRNLYQNVERRLQSARQRGDRDLVQVLERELQQIA
jgi:hypothetical protein